MSNNPEKTEVVDNDGEKNYESDTRDIVHGLPALSVITAGVVVGEEEEPVVVGGELARASVEETAGKGKDDGSGSSGEKESRQKKLKITDEATGSGKGEMENPKNTAGLTHLAPKGSSVCNVCGRGFSSRKALFGHMNVHRHTHFKGVLPPEFTAAVKRCSILGQNSSFIRIASEGGSSSGVGTGGGNVNGNTSGERKDTNEQCKNDEPEKEKQETHVNEQAVVAAQLVIGALEEALAEEIIVHGGIGGEITRGRGELKKTEQVTDGKGKRKGSNKKDRILSQHAPEGSSVCKVCGKWFKSHNALCGHMNAHRHTPFQGALPPEFIEIVKKGQIQKQNASLVGVTIGGESSNNAANERASDSIGTDSPESIGGKSLSIDINVKLVEEVKAITECASDVKIDLNKSPPKEKEEENECAASDVKIDLNKSPPNDKEDEEKAK